MWILKIIFIISTFSRVNGDSHCEKKKCHRNRECERGRCRRPASRLVCDLGFIPNASGECVVNPCINHACHKNAECSVVPKEDEYEAICECKNGFLGDGTLICTADYCKLGRHKCGAFAQCKTLGAEYEYDYECFCIDGYVGFGSRHRDTGGSGFRRDCMAFPCEEKSTPPTDERYSIYLPTNLNDGLNWFSAQQMCQEKGLGWDLAVIESETEFENIMELMNCETKGVWLGYKKDANEKIFEDVFGDPAVVINKKWSEGEPNLNPEKDACLRLQVGLFSKCSKIDLLMRDGNCRASRYGSKHTIASMGYICERHDAKPAPGIRCETESDNDRVEPFETKDGCPAPSCFGGSGFQIVDAWRKRDQGTYAYNYGFTAAFFLGTDAHDDDGASIMMRFARGNRQHNIQTWNLKFWGFYNDNRDVLFHTKHWPTDRLDRRSVIVTVENLNTADYPEVFFWKNRITKHRCFMPELARSRPQSLENIVRFLKPEVKDLEEIRQVSFKNGRFRKIKV
ncbi:unnamed protein product [Oikopleura dioica]|uniref:C-type lectin domain-containing protein n=1 Tax=Oikopleura dioica TaxID=34765 RepID=E4YP38_OIKDI|nr:unnamed protein product [Oikopleura dioica]